MEYFANDMRGYERSKLYSTRYTRRDVLVALRNAYSTAKELGRPVGVQWHMSGFWMLTDSERWLSHDGMVQECIAVVSPDGSVECGGRWDQPLGVCPRNMKIKRKHRSQVNG